MPKQAPISYDEIRGGLSDLGLKDSTAQTYISKIRKVLKGTFGQDAVTKQTLKKGKKKIVDYVSSDAYKNANTRKVALMAICHLFTLYDLPVDYFEKYVVDWSRLADAEAVTNTSSKTIEDIKGIDFDAIQASIPDTKDPTDRLIKAFYTMLPPLRQQDLIGLKVFETLAAAKQYKGNVLVLKPARLLIREHKTERSHGEKSIPIPAKLSKEVRRYMKAEDTDVLFPLSTSGFTRRMQRLFGCSTSTFRKAYVTKVAPTLTASERARVAEIMGHRISTSMVSYNKDIKTDPELTPDEPVEEEDDE